MISHKLAALIAEFCPRGSYIWFDGVLVCETISKIPYVFFHVGVPCFGPQPYLPCYWTLELSTDVRVYPNYLVVANAG